jgi:hypothetical protein
MNPREWTIATDDSLRGSAGLGNLTWAARPTAQHASPQPVDPPGQLTVWEAE